MIKYNVKYTSNFKKCFKKVNKQGKDIEKLLDVIDKLAYKETLDKKYKNHNLINDKHYNNCCECHIDSDWLLIYKYMSNNTVLLLIGTGSHSDMFN